MSSPIYFEIIDKIANITTSAKHKLIWPTADNKESLYLESIILNKDYKYVENKYEENNSKISDLIGVRGKIQKNEFCESIDKFLNLI